MASLPIEDIEKKVGSRYALTVLAGMRARELRDGSPRLVNTESNNPILIALQEIQEGKIYVDARTEAPEAGETTEGAAELDAALALGATTGEADAEEPAAEVEAAAPAAETAVEPAVEPETAAEPEAEASVEIAEAAQEPAEAEESTEPGEDAEASEAAAEDAVPAGE